MSYRSKFTATINNIGPLLILLLAFGLQMAYLHELRTVWSPGGPPFCGVDAEAHLQRAGGLLDGSLPGSQTFYFIPLYPLYLAALKSLLGDWRLLPVVLQMLLQLVGVAALYRLGRIVYSPLTGLAAALGLATYGPYLFYTPCFDQTLLTTPFFTLALLFLLLSTFWEQRAIGLVAAAGIALALATLSRPTLLLVYPVILLWLYWRRRNRRQWLGQSLALLLPFCLMAAPISWHNYRVSGRFILLSDNFAVNLFTGNNPYAAGLDSLAHIQSQPAVVYFKALYPRVSAGETTLTAEVWRYITGQPADWLALMATKCWLWVAAPDERLVSPFFPLRVAQSRTLAPLPLSWRAIALTGLLGGLLVRGRREGLLWAVYGLFSAATILFFIQLRFRLPFLPFVLLLSASLATAGPGMRRRYPRRFWGTLLILLLFFPFIPGLCPVILLFAGPGLWPLREKWFRWAAVGLLLYLLLGGWWSRADRLASDVSQAMDHYLGPPLAGPTILGQTFRMDCDGLHRVEVTLGLFHDTRPDQPVIFSLAADRSGEEIIYTETFRGEMVRDYQRRAFSFPPLPDSAGQSYFFFLASPTSPPDRALTARGYSDTPVDYYPPGRGWAGEPDRLQSLQADFAFTAYCRMSLWEKMVRGVIAPSE